MSCIRKQGSLELNSRLKTRKVLGVGETNDGDVHRSKLSQILGHSEQLYVKVPRGLKAWQLLSALLYVCIAISESFQPGSMLLRPKLKQQQQRQVGDTDLVSDRVTSRLYAAALLGLSHLLWRSFFSVDRELMRVSLLSSLIYSLLHVTVFSVTWISLSSSSSTSSSWLSLLSVDQRSCFNFVSSEFIQLFGFFFFFVVTLFFYRSLVKY